MEQLPYPEVIRARDETNMRKYGESLLLKATDICQKIHLAILEADKFFPGGDLFRKNPVNKKAELGVIFDAISRHLSMLNVHLVQIQGANFPVDKEVTFFHHILDRLIIMSAILTRDYARVHEPRKHYRRPDTVPAPPVFSLLTTNITEPHDRFNMNLYLGNYVSIGITVGNTLLELHNKMQGAVLKEAISAERKNDILGSWLAQQSIRFARREEQPVDDPLNEPAVVIFAIRTFIDLRNNRSDVPSVKNMFMALTNKILLLRKNRNKTHPGEAVLNTIMRLETELYQNVAFICRTNYKGRIPTPEQQRKHDEDIEKFEWVLEVMLAQLDPLHRDLPGAFSSIVKRARDTIPYGRADEILDLAKAYYYTGDETLFEKAGKPKPWVPLIVAPQVTLPSAKRTQQRRSKANTGKAKDVLRQVKERAVIKRKEKRARFASPPINRESWSPQFIHYNSNNMK